MRVVGEIFRYKQELLCYDECGSAKPQIKVQEAGSSRPPRGGRG